MRSIILCTAISLGLAGCQRGNLPPESRCTMYWDYYYNSGLGKPIAERRKAEGVDFNDIRTIVRNDPSAKTKVCRKILSDAFPQDPVLKQGKAPDPAD